MLTKLERIEKGELAEELGLTPRRVHSLIDIGVLVAGHDELFDRDRNARRYRAFREKDREYVIRDMEDASDRLQAGLKSLRAEPNIQKRRKIDEREKIGANIGRIDAAMRLGNAMADEGQRPLLGQFTANFIGGAMAEYFNLLALKFVGDEMPARAKRSAKRSARA